MIVINLLSSGVFLKELTQWLLTKNQYNDFINGLPTAAVAIFVPIASLSMTANVIWGPLAFFVPDIAANMQAMMLPALIFYGFLWLMLFLLEFKLLKIWLTQSLDSTKLHFVWLLDVFAFGLVNLTGTGIAAMASDKMISSIAAFASLFALTAGVFLCVIKLAYLFYLQIKSSSLPPKPVQPSFFILIPITCLFSYSFYRLTLYLNTHFAINVDVLSFIFINFSYVITISWGIFCLYLLNDYFKNYFYNSEFAAPQWAMI